MPRILLPWYNKVLGRRRRRGGCGWKEVNFREEMEQGLPQPMQPMMMPVAFPLRLWQRKGKECKCVGTNCVLVKIFFPHFPLRDEYYLVHDGASEYK